MNKNNASELTLLKTQLITQWQIDDDAFIRVELNEETLIGILAMRVLYLMQNKMDTLITALYRMDVGEQKFDMAMSASSQPKAAKKVAEAIYTRELQRLQSRLRFEKQQLAQDKGDSGEWPQVIA
jgi:hypothetical protein